ncbi:MAG: ABC transporter substrate-binding protein [Nitrospinaceae bacterium]|jgi:ABC-type nitrate/sulfonate/bicarbonate transport system substrate-binding protein|nr:ABC transporter substrate-binding protein [Nitrospinaceae bacterium]MBT3435182.1 ABC transporter substrate-binding protein [Nitrospinaceae bacterium]MBT3821731.1 ABC transporter substrate-binding protein [Nitrospinaceae bacterium]MBT4092663.1 ABC transporter substrate-binding protein [Nitrospinaceae bacterium]MBT4430040.1 ABC transporter substrate-binding protein [Nitrospinaceae bacterium]
MRISRILLTIFVFVGLVDVQGLSQAGAADKFVLGMPVRPPIMVHLPVFYALDKGFFKKNGLDVDVQFFRGGNATHRAITSANSKLDAAVAPAALAMVGITKGSGLKFFHSMGYKLEAQIAAAPGIDNVQKLRGKTFGIEGRGGFSHLAIRSILEPAGVNDKEVKYMKTPPPARVPFLLNKKVDAVVIHVEQVLLAQKKRPGITALGSLWKLRPHQFYNAFMARSSQINKNKDAYVRFAVAMMQANRSIYKDKKGFLESAKKWLRPVYKKNFEVVGKTYDYFVKERIWAVNSGMPKKSIEWTAKFLKNLKKIKSAIPPADSFIAKDVVKATIGKVGEVLPSER